MLPLPGLIGCAEAQQPAAGVHYKLSFPRRATQYVHVELRIPAEGETLDVSMPNWIPGAYLIRDYAGQVELFKAHSPAGEPLNFSKISKNRWRIETGGVDEVQIAYDVWAGTLSVRDSWVENDFALLNGAGVFMYSDASRHLPQFLEVERPAEWGGVYVALPGPDAQGAFRAADFDELVDSPVLAGTASVDSFEAGGAEFDLVTYGASGLWDADRAIRDLTRMAEAQIEFWGVNPFDRKFLFINVLLGERGGLEHDHSTVMMGDASLMRSRDEYVKWLALASHELFHAWNVRRMRPEALAQYDYDAEVYTRQLWLAEGLTSYYDNLLLFRSGAITVPEYFDLLAAEMQQYELQPGREVISAEQASFDSWIRQYKPNPNLVNSNSNYYRKGALIGFVIDTAIRRETGNNRNLDDAMREMYSRYGPLGENGGSYPRGALASVVEELAGAEIAQRLRMLLTDPVDPDIDGALAWYGLELLRSPERDAAEVAGAPVPVDFGATWQSDTQLLLVDHVLHGSTAADAGLLPNDELLAINGRRVTRDSIDAYMKKLYLGEEVSLTLARHGQLVEKDVTMQHLIPAKYTITVAPDIGGREERRLEGWLGRMLQIRK